MYVKSEHAGADAVFNGLVTSFNNRNEYIDYWGSIAADTADEYFKRWLFAFCSVHTTWKYNVAAYQAIKDFREWETDKEDLRSRLIESRAGLFNSRTDNIWAFHADFWGNTNDFYRGKDETWAQLRDRLVARIKGLGAAKTSFALEMAFPLEARVTCLDVHMLRLYGKEDLNGRAPKPVYAAIEENWGNGSDALCIPPYIARCAYWDGVQGKTDSKYWSHVLEN